jgi:crotonobetainyl-CoA:carnitine CoA-transferase CaiB-like acyl-CoA transferase
MIQDAGRAPDDEAPASGPLVGVRVLDAGNMIAGPMAACFLGDYGADVIKIEHPTLHDPLRDWEPKRDDVSLWWKVLNRNKRLITLSLSQAAGRDVFMKLVEWADVVVENFRPGTFEKWELSYEQLAERNPRVVLARVSGYGQTGPYRGRPGYGTIAEAMSGIPFFTGPEDAPPTLPGFPMADSISGLFTALGVMAALHERNATPNGRGQEVDLGLYESLFRLVDSQVIGYDQLGLIKRRMGNRLAEDAPRNAYETADEQWIAISASSNRTWQRLATAIGRPELADDPRFNTSSRRIQNSVALDGILGAWFRRRPCRDAIATLAEYDVVAGPVLSIADIFDDPQYAARENIITVADPDFGTVRMQGVVPRFVRTPGAVRFPGLAPGAHNAAVYCDLIGMDPAALAQLQSAGVV